MAGVLQTLTRQISGRRNNRLEVDRNEIEASRWKCGLLVTIWCFSRNKDAITSDRLSGVRVLVIAGSQEKFTMPEVRLSHYGCNLVKMSCKYY